MGRTPTERELREQLDDVGDAKTIYEWLNTWLDEKLENGEIEVTAGPIPVPDDEVVAYVSTDGEEFSVPPEALPAWIDIDDLPIYGREDRRNPFVIADVT